MILIDQDVAHSFRPILQPKEKVLWAGRPKGLTYDWAVAWTMVLMILLSAVAIGVFVWIFSVDEFDFDNALTLIFGAVATITVFHGAIKDTLLFLAPLNEQYALTNQRVLIRSGLITSRVHGRSLPDIPGRIRKGHRLDFRALRKDQKKRSDPLRFRFLGVDNAEEVEALFHQQLNRIKAS